ncbi:hypothetical protein [Streptomyces sp. BSE6.1]|uniref:hypothetical protein n=1 Tax=Streptomyces sp. BSE6.1 TaxID=2605730 RepID=UPI001F1C11BC|nr:hypothetical protein [Streptomyces sp. BSE6.1]
MTDIIRVQPARDRLRDFARWATGFPCKLRTAGLHTFAVPPAAFTEAPEELLIGALVDGHRYRSPAEDEAKGRLAPGALVVVGETGPETVVPLREALPGDELPPVPDDAYPADATPLPAPGTTDGDTAEAFSCPQCARTFETERGRDTHSRQAHRED